MISILFRKTVLSAMTAVLALAAPLSSALAVDPPADREISNERLEKIWARELEAYNRLGGKFERSDEFVEKVQGLIDKAAENGRDVSAVQAALDAFEAAVGNARPIYESAREIINAHAGFDENGKVTDAAQAKETVRALGDKLKEIKSAMGGTGRALREAIRAFREASKPDDSPPERDS